MVESGIDLNHIIDHIKNVLSRNHAMDSKKDVRCYPSNSNPDRIAFACPHCGDSQKHAFKKRCNLYVESMMVKCFNCGMYSSITSFFEKFSETIDVDEKMRIYNHIDSNVKYTRNTDDTMIKSLDKLMSIGEFCEYFNNRTNSWLCDIMPVQAGSKVYKYLKIERLLPDFGGIYQGIYRVVRDGKVKFKTEVMINMNIGGGDKLLGIQLRNLEKEKNKRFYKIVEFDELYNYMHPGEPLDELEAISYNKLSHFYNIMNVDFDRPINVFEGFIDSKFSPNSIGLVGLNSSRDMLNFLTESEEDLNLRFFYDNDASGIKAATDMIKAGYSVFLWEKLFGKIIAKSTDKVSAKNRLDNIKDLNELVVDANCPTIYHKLSLDDYFSTDEFDMVYLKKVYFDKTEKVWKVLKK